MISPKKDYGTGELLLGAASVAQGTFLLIDETALVAALQSRPQLMAGLDVYRNEPLPVASPLSALPNVVLLPHLGGGSYRSNEVDTQASLRNIQRFFAGESVAGIIN